MPLIEEVTESEVFEIKQQALSDFDYLKEHLQKKLQVFSFDEILASIERSSHRSMDVCRTLVL